VLRIVDKTETHVIQKVVNRKGVVTCYQTVPHEAVGNSTQVQRFATLAKARLAAGKELVNNSDHTIPKTAYPEQQRGFKRYAKGHK